MQGSLLGLPFEPPIALVHNPRPDAEKTKQGRGLRAQTYRLFREGSKEEWVAVTEEPLIPS